MLLSPADNKNAVKHGSRPQEGDRDTVIRRPTTASRRLGGAKCTDHANEKQSSSYVRHGQAGLLGY